jgi:hypothetical protein
MEKARIAYGGRFYCFMIAFTFTALRLRLRYYDVKSNKKGQLCMKQLPYKQTLCCFTGKEFENGSS